MPKKETSRVRLSFVLATVILVGVHDVSASTPCVKDGRRKGSDESVFQVKRDDLLPGRVLLGLNGSRVQVPQTMTPEPGGLPWHARVDWGAYKLPLSNEAAAAIIQVETDRKGNRYLCHIEWRDYIYEDESEGSKRNGTPNATARRIGVVARMQIVYDERRRTISIVEHEIDPDRRILKLKRNACLHYDVKDNYIGASFVNGESCARAKPADIVDRFVYAIDGTLLRKISAEQSMPGIDGGNFVTKSARVTIFDPAGSPVAEYVNENNRIYRRSLAAHADDSQYHGIKIVKVSPSVDFGTIIDKGYSGFWQLYSLPSSVANRSAGTYEDRYLIASGDNPNPSQDVREEIWKAMNRLDHDLVLQADGIFLLVPEISASAWNACINPWMSDRNGCN